MNIFGLTTIECEILLDSLDYWVKKDGTGEMIFDMVMGMITENAPPEIKQKREKDRKIAKNKEKSEKKLREEQSIILKAKLLKLRDSIAAGEI
jgi:hypothetical protein